MFWPAVVLQALLLPFAFIGCSWLKGLFGNNDDDSPKSRGGMPGGGQVSNKQSQSERGIKDSNSSRKPVESQKSATEKSNQFKFGGLNTQDEDDDPKTNLMSVEGCDNPLLTPEVRAKLFKKKMAKSGKGVKTEATLGTTMVPVEATEEKTQEEDVSCRTKKGVLTTAEVTVELNEQYMKGAKKYGQKKGKASETGRKGASQKSKRAVVSAKKDVQPEEVLNTQMEVSARDDLKFSAETQSAYLSKEPATMKTTMMTTEKIV